MLIPPQYKLTKTIVNLLQEIEHLKTKFDLLPQNKILEKYNRQKSLLKSALYSARIEGNPRTLKEISLPTISNSREKTKIEINNLYKVLTFILTRTWNNDLNIEDLEKLHLLILQKLSPEAGSLRRESSAIFNSGGAAIYLCPMPYEIKSLLKKWLHFVNEKNESLIPIKAGLAHYSFEKIHPFLDGNGRIGRLLIHLLFKKWKYDLRGLISFEQHIDQYRETYYDLLNLNKKDITLFVKFFLNGLRVSLEKAITIKAQVKNITTEDLLPPRRLEILQIIRDHKQVSLDFIKRRFMLVSNRLLRYDLKRLADKKFIKKRGVTRGVVYEPLLS